MSTSPENPARERVLGEPEDGGVVGMGEPRAGTGNLSLFY